MYIHFVLITYFLIADFLLIPGLQPAPCIAGENSPTVLTSLLNCVQVLKKVLLETIGNTWHSMHWQVSSRLLPWKSECFICQTGEVSILLVQSTEYQIPLVINPNPDLIWRCTLLTDLFVCLLQNMKSSEVLWQSEHGAIFLEAPFHF